MFCWWEGAIRGRHYYCYCCYYYPSSRKCSAIKTLLSSHSLLQTIKGSLHTYISFFQTRSWIINFALGIPKRKPFFEAKSFLDVWVHPEDVNHQRRTLKTKSHPSSLDLLRLESSKMQRFLVCFPAPYSVQALDNILFSQQSEEEQLLKECVTQNPLKEWQIRLRAKPNTSSPPLTKCHFTDQWAIKKKCYGETHSKGKCIFFVVQVRYL